MGAKPSPTKNLLFAAFLGLCVGTVGEILLLTDTQCRKAEETLVDDLRILAFVAPGLPESKLKDVEAALRALPGLADLRYVSRDTVLAELRELDPELTQSVALLGENPLDPAFELRLVGEAVSKTADIAEAASRVSGIGDIRFKPMQVRAILQLQLFERFLRLGMGLGAFFWFLGAAAVVWAAMVYREARPALEDLPVRLGLAAVGVAGGMGLVMAAAYPLRSQHALWSWASPAAHAALAVAGTLGGLLAWDWGKASHGERKHPRDSAQVPDLAVP